MILLSGTSNKKLSSNIAKYLNMSLTKCIIDGFKCGEIRVEILETVRGKDVVIIQSGYNKTINTNDIVIETILLVDACRRSMSKSITLIMPLFPYARQDRKDTPRVPISAKVIANMFQNVGIDRIVCLDLHSPQIQGFFQCPADNLYSVKLIKNKLEKLFNISKNKNKYILISPDAGAVKRSIKFAQLLGL